MKILILLRIWFKYQLSLNWLNILFRYAIKLMLLINFLIISLTIFDKFKLKFTQFEFFFIVIALVDLLIKLKFIKTRQNIRAFQLIPQGVFFLSVLNLLQDVFSLRNVVLPLIAVIVFNTLGWHPMPSVVHLLVISCMNTIVSGFGNNRKKLIATGSVIIVIMTTLRFYSDLFLIMAIISPAILLVLYLKYSDKIYAGEYTWVSQRTNSVFNIRNPFLWLDVQILKKSKHLQLTFVKVFGVCLLYGYIISTYSSQSAENSYGLMLLLQIYYALVPAALIPYILSSHHSYIGLLLTVPNVKSFFITKFNVVIVIQFLLTLVLYLFNFGHAQILFQASAICMFNIFLITPVMFMGILLTDEKVNIFGSGINNVFFAPSFVQSIYILFVLLCAGLMLYLLHWAGSAITAYAAIGLGVASIFLRELSYRFFHANYKKRKYDLYKILS